MWLNLRGFGDVLDPIDPRPHVSRRGARHRIGGGRFSALGLAHLGRRGGRISGGDAVVRRCVFSVAAPVVARGAGAVRRRFRRGRRPPRSNRSRCRAAAHVRMLMFDGASLDMISPAVAAGRLPNIARIFDQGAVLHLATLRPTQAEPVWSAIATGRYPMYNGVRSAVVYRALGGTPIQLLPDYCFAQALVTLRISDGGAADRHRSSGAADLEHPQRSRRDGRRDWLAVDVSGAGRERLRGQRRVSSPAATPS